MAKIYAGSELTVTGYLLTVETRGNYATLVMTVPADEYTAKDGSRRKVPAQTHKFDVGDSFAAAITQLDQGARLRVTGKGSAREYTDKTTGALRTFTSFRLTDLQPCNDLAELPKAAESEVPF